MSVTPSEETDSTERCPRTFEYSSQQREEIICTESLFDQTSQQTPEISDELQNLSKRRVKIHLHAVTLSDYVRQGIIPRGLRWQKEPMLGQKSEEFHDQWCAILNKCSFDLMTLLIADSKRELDELDGLITEKKKLLSKTIKNQTQFNELLKQNQELEDKLAKETKERKIRKFNRDKKDAMENNIYHWRNPERKMRKRRPMMRQPPEYFSSDQLSSASSSSFLSERARDRAAPTQGNRGGGHKKRPTKQREGANSENLHRTRSWTYQQKK